MDDVGGRCASAVYAVQIIWKNLFQLLKQSTSKICFILCVCEKWCLRLKLHKPAVSFNTDYTPSTLVAVVVPHVEPSKKKKKKRKELGQLIPVPQSFPLDSMEDFYPWSKDTIVLCCSQNIVCVGKAGLLPWEQFKFVQPAFMQCFVPYLMRAPELSNEITSFSRHRWSN